MFTLEMSFQNLPNHKNYSFQLLPTIQIETYTRIKI